MRRCGGNAPSYQHGEVVPCGMPGDFRTAAGTVVGGNGIAAALPDDLIPTHTKITTTNTATYHVGDVLQFSSVNGMYRLDYMEGTVQTVGVGGPNNFTVDMDCRKIQCSATLGCIEAICSRRSGPWRRPQRILCARRLNGIDPTQDKEVYWANNGPTSFLSNRLVPQGDRSSGSISVQVTLNVGGRGAAPIRLYCEVIPASNFGQAYLYAGPGTTRPFWYDKNAIARRNQDGSVTFGVWWTADAPNAKEVYNASPVGIGYFLKLINELEMMIVEQDLQQTKGPISPWICVNCYGLLRPIRTTIRPTISVSICATSF